MAKHKKSYSREERLLFKRAAQGDKKAQETLILKNQGLVHYVIHKWFKSWKLTSLTQEDLVQEGILGLQRAIKEFDVDRGFRFATYAVVWIRQYIQRAIYNTDRMIRKPVHLHEMLRDISKANEALYHQLGREPTNEEVAKQLDLEPVKVERVKQAFMTVTSLSKPVFENNEDTELVDLIADKSLQDIVKRIEIDDLAKKLDEMLAQFPKREQGILRMRYGLSPYTGQHTLEEIGIEFHVSMERVRQILNSTLKRLHSRKSSLIQFHRPNV